MNCRLCNEPLTRSFLDLGHMPLANSYLTQKDLTKPEVSYPLKVLLCEKCLLLQLEVNPDPEKVFTDYDYFSSTSPTWLKESEKKAEMLTERFGLTKDSLVVEAGSNDGVLLRHFYVPEVLGVDPAEGCVSAALKVGVPTVPDFFGRRVATDLVEDGRRADLFTCTNTFAHVPALWDFVGGVATILKPDGVAVFEFPHIMATMEGNQFDQVYGEHVFYFSAHSATRVLAWGGLSVFDIEEVPTHGGSLRVYARHAYSGRQEVRDSVNEFLTKEREAGLDTPEGYDHFARKVEKVKQDLRRFLVDARDYGERVAAYGAPAKGMTLLNACGVDRSLVEFVVDDSPHKQGKFTPGTHIPIVTREHLINEQPDHLLVLAWNLAGPIKEANNDYGGRWHVAIPELKEI